MDFCSNKIYSTEKNPTLPLLKAKFLSILYYRLLLKDLNRLLFHTIALALARALLDLTKSLSHLLFFYTKLDFEWFYLWANVKGFTA